MTNYDGENFIFHSTLFQDSNISNKHNKMIDELLSEFEFPIKIDIKEINLGISETGKVGTFNICDRIKLK